MLCGVEVPNAEFFVEARGQHGQRFVNRNTGGIGYSVHALEGADHTGGIDQCGLSQAVDDGSPGFGQLIGIGQYGVSQIEQFLAAINTAISRPVGGGDRVAGCAIELAVLTEQE